MPGDYTIRAQKDGEDRPKEITSVPEEDVAVVMAEALAESGKYARISVTADYGAYVAFSWPERFDGTFHRYQPDQPSVTTGYLVNLLAQSGIRFRLESTDDLGVRWTLLHGEPFPPLDVEDRGHALAPSPPGWARQGKAAHLGRATIELCEAVVELHPESWFATDHWSCVSDRDKELLFREP